MVAIKPLNSLTPSLASGSSFASGRMGGVNPRAQNLSVSRLNYQKSIDNAKVSTNQVSNPGARALSSISRLNNKNTVSTSINGKKRDLNQESTNSDSEADDKRYEYVRRLAMARRQKKEAEASALSAKPEPNKYDIGVTTGTGFGRKFQVGLDRKFFKTAQKQSRASFKHLDKSDRKYFLDLVEKHATKVRVGTGLGRQVRKGIKMQIERDRRKGVISLEDARDLKKFTDNLPH